jgi:tetratricopeptide (TPR) repeat protein
VRVGVSAKTLADIYLEQGKGEQALELYRRAVAAFEPSDPNLAGALLGSARALATVGRRGEARATIERAVAFASERALPALPEAEAALARMLWPTERARARALADKALAAFAAAGKDEERGELAAWLAARP